MQFMFLGGGGPVIASNVDHASSASFQNSHSFSMSVGAPGSRRAIAAVVNYKVAGSQNGPISIATIGGVNAYPPLRTDVLDFGGATAEAHVAIFAAFLDTTATTATIAFSSAADIAIDVSLYRLLNLSSLTPVDTAGATMSGTSQTVNLDTVDDGVLLAGAMAVNVSTPQFSAGVTQDTTNNLGGSGLVAGSFQTSAQTNRAVTVIRVGGAASLQAAITAVSLR